MSKVSCHLRNVAIGLPLTANRGVLEDCNNGQWVQQVPQIHSLHYRRGIVVCWIAQSHTTTAQWCWPWLLEPLLATGLLVERPGTWRAAFQCGTGESAVIPTPVRIVTVLRGIARLLVIVSQSPAARFVDLKFITDYRHNLIFPSEVRTWTCIGDGRIVGVVVCWRTKKLLCSRCMWSVNCSWRVDLPT